ncbi:hypothetical protein MF672_010720 [Actinomadura sp. ATCC 31491]|uniref:MarR family transcriptional regulator n=1 Tax=Actinomadura luzonensis TaxID=2805427 RepID=A0ABT0FPP9_9ACTN|nr:hypothetical protein [Actinomadura luzonensis]MCK2214259.1 hypothetical protein [Actinomadura luzonensis]
MTLTGTCVLAYLHAADALDALATAVGLSPAALGLLVRYLARPPAPGTARGDIAAAYGMSIGELRAGNRELAAAGHLLQVRRCVGAGAWQHLIVATDTPGTLPAPHEAWVLLDAALAAEQAARHPVDDDTSPEDAHVVTCDDTETPQATTCDPQPRIEPVTPFSLDLDASEPGAAATVVATVADLARLAQLPPLPAPKDQANLWLTPGQVLTLIGRYPPRYGELALRTLARRGLPWYLAPSVVALLIAGYDIGQLGRALAGVELADHPAAVARWRLDQLLLADPVEHAAWRSPSTYVPDQAPPADPAAPSVREQLAAARAAMDAARAKHRSRGAAA